MKVYHGSDTVVQKPRILHSKRRMDFGSGFYTTQSRTQAEKWARSVRRRRDSPEAFVTEFDYEEKPEMNVLIFDGPFAEWFDFIIRNRKGTFTHDYDIIIGPVADDSVYDTLFLFESGYITREEAIRKLNSAKLDGQILFHTDKSLECITYIDSWEVE
ncbi:MULTISPECIES: DUF3990 domain-containing protein [Methanomassiliicoccales]|uniref:DUF3990 domain-containing protein n=1 Tax=Methanomassiliicoccales TaxID=1235850 RepID=UPI0037DD391E